MGILECFMSVSVFLVLIPIMWFFDYLRLKDELRIIGRKLIKMHWRLWDGNGNWDKARRIYLVTYIDGLGGTYTKYCKMGFGMGNTSWD